MWPRRLIAQDVAGGRDFVVAVLVLLAPAMLLDPSGVHEPGAPDHVFEKAVFALFQFLLERAHRRTYGDAGYASTQCPLPAGSSFQLGSLPSSRSETSVVGS